MLENLDRSSPVLLAGIGGGGDVVGTFGVATMLESLGFETRVGGASWERLPVDPVPGPRSLAELSGGRVLGDCLVEVGGACAPLTAPSGAELAESRLARHTGRDVLVFDLSEGAEGVARAMAAALEATGAGALLLVDIGGDVLGEGHEPGLASPLCDAVMLAGGVAGAPAGTPVFLGVLGAGCDGEMHPEVVVDRVGALTFAGAARGALGITPDAASVIEEASDAVPTEASRNVARVARGELGETEIRGGRRTVVLHPSGSLCFWFDAREALAELPLTRAVGGTASIEAAREALAARGVRTELDWERENAPR